MDENKLAKIINEELDFCVKLFDEQKGYTSAGYDEHKREAAFLKLAMVKRHHSALIRIAEAADVPTYAYRRSDR